MSDFDALTLALEDWFATPLGGLPDALRDRVEKEFAPMKWGQLSAEKRRAMALQLDCQLDPAAERQRQCWWDHEQRKEELMVQIAQWEAAAAPTARELELRETRLKELRLEITRMEKRELQDRSEYYPVRKPPDGDSKSSPIPSGSPALYLAYPKAMAQLRTRLDATPEELAAWIWVGPEDGGVTAYVNGNELDPPPRFYFGLGTGKGDDHDYVALLMACWFREDEIAAFNPVERYITGEALIKRWGERPGLRTDAWVRAKIREARLLDIHPLYGGTQATWPDDASMPPMATALFRLSEVQRIEAEDFDTAWRPADVPEHRGEAVAGAVLAGPADPATGTAAPPVSASDEHTGPGEAAGPNDICSVFRAMEALAVAEVGIAFVGDRAEEGIGANNLLEVSARGQIRRVPLTAFNLIDRRQGTLNSQGAILLGLTRGMKLPANHNNSAKMSRLRDALRSSLGLAGDPFQPFVEGTGWLPAFHLADKRGAADRRAERDAARKTTSYEQMIERGGEFSDPSDHDQDAEGADDAAAAWLRDHGGDSSR